MASAKLSIIIDAEVEQAAKEIGHLGDVIDKEMAQAAKGVAGFNKATVALAKATPNATAALSNFGRVVQDAPFGILGIANNIDPLIASFQALKTQTGSAGGALKAMVAGLAGPAGIAIAISAVTSLLIAFGPEIKAFIFGVDKAGEAAKKAAEDQKAIISALGEEAGKVTTLISVIQSETTTREEKNSALKELNRISPKFFEGLEFEKDTVPQITAAYDKYIDNLVKVAQAQAVTGALSDLFTKRLEIQKKLIGSDLPTALDKQRAQFEKIDKAIASGQGVGVVTAGLSLAEQEALNLNKQMSDIDKEVKLLLSSSSGFTSDFVKPIEDATKASKDLTETIFSEAIAYDKLLASKVGNTNASTALISANQQLLDLARLANVEAAKKNTLDTAAKLKSIQGAAGGVISTTGKGPAAEATKILAANQEAQAAVIANAETISNILAPAVQSVFTAIAEGDNVFKAVADAVKQMVVQLALAVAQALIFQAIMAALTGGGSAAGGGGKALGFLSGLFRETGGPAFANTPHIVGESGPELFIPSSAGSIQPNSQMGGGGTLSTSVSGNNLLFVLNNALSNKRNFG